MVRKGVGSSVLSADAGSGWQGKLHIGYANFRRFEDLEQGDHPSGIITASSIQTRLIKVLICSRPALLTCMNDEANPLESISPSRTFSAKPKEPWQGYPSYTFTPSTYCRCGSKP